jgi:hypothetical protein
MPATITREQPRAQSAAPAAAARAPANTTPGGSPSVSKIRARYSAGALHPLEALDLDEGEIVELSITKPNN